MLLFSQMCWMVMSSRHKSSRGILPHHQCNIVDPSFKEFCLIYSSFDQGRRFLFMTGGVIFFCGTDWGFILKAQHAPNPNLCRRKKLTRPGGGGGNEMRIFYKDFMRGSVATEREFCCISLNAALLGPPEPKSVLQSYYSVYAKHFVDTFSNFPGGGDDPPLKLLRGNVSPPPRSPGIAAPAATIPPSSFWHLRFCKRFFFDFVSFMWSFILFVILYLVLLTWNS